MREVENTPRDIIVRIQETVLFSVQKAHEPRQDMPTNNAVCDPVSQQAAYHSAFQ